MSQLKKLLIGVCLFGYGTTIIAQTTIPASGGNASGSGGTASYSVGQIVYIKNTGTNGSASQGVQQPYEISVVTGIIEAKDILLEFVVYPNPASDLVRLKISNFEIQNLKYQLYDMNGNLMQQNYIFSDETNIPLQSFLPSIYFLKIIQDRKEIKTFKIIKN